MRWLVWLMKTAVKTTFICAVCIYVTFTLVQMYMTQLLQPLYPALSTGQTIQIFDLLSQVSPWRNTNKEAFDDAIVAGQEIVEQPNPFDQREGEGIDSDIRMNEQEKRSTYETSDHYSQSNSEDVPEASEIEEREMEDAVAVWGNLDFSLSYEDIIRMKDELSEEEKMNIFSIIASNIPLDEIQHLSVLLENGLSSSEIKQIDELIRQYLDESEYERFLDMIFHVGTE